MKELLLDTLYDLYNLLWRPIQQAKCFFLGHDIVCVFHNDYLEPPEDDHCRRCMLLWPEERFTIPYAIARIGSTIYTWFVVQDWKWFNKFDFWLVKHKAPLPPWWEY